MRKIHFIHKTNRLVIPGWRVHILVTLPVGLSFTSPLFQFVRRKALRGGAQ